MTGMTDWKPKFKEGDVVVSQSTGYKYRVPEAYVRGEEHFDAARSSDPSQLFYFKRDFFDQLMVLEGAPGNWTPTATKPNYYRFKVRGQEMDIIDVIQSIGLGCEAGNVYKYLCRAGRKDASKHLEDLKKAREWLDRLIQFHTEGGNPQ